MENRYLLGVDLVLVVGSLVFLVFLVGYARPLVIAPLDDYESGDKEILFLVEKAEILLIDDNVEFSSPDEYNIEDGLEIVLEPGKYYWKAIGILDGEVRTLTIRSEVILELVQVEDGFGVVNSGNVVLNVDVYNGTKLVGNVRLDRWQMAEGEQGDKFVGEMK